jgi:hypothetical protein
MLRKVSIAIIVLNSFRCADTTVIPSGVPYLYFASNVTLYSGTLGYAQLEVSREARVYSMLEVWRAYGRRRGQTAHQTFVAAAWHKNPLRKLDIIGRSS